MKRVERVGNAVIESESQMVTITFKAPRWLLYLIDEAIDAAKSAGLEFNSRSQFIRWAIERAATELIRSEASKALRKNGEC